MGNKRVEIFASGGALDYKDEIGNPAKKCHVKRSQQSNWISSLGNFAAVFPPGGSPFTEETFSGGPGKPTPPAQVKSGAVAGKPHPYSVAVVKTDKSTLTDDPEIIIDEG